MEEEMQSFHGVALIGIDPEPRILRRSMTFSCVFNGFSAAAGAAAL
jgi:hypothetical protein